MAIKVDTFTSVGGGGGAVTSVNGNTGAVVLSGNDLAADHTAVNYTATNANIDGHLSGIDTAIGVGLTPTLDDVTTNGDTTTNNISVGQVTVSGDILANADATHTIGAEATRFISYYGDMNGAIRFKAKNDNGSAITKGQAVYINGVNGTVPTVALAQANSAATMPAFGLALTNANDQAEVQVISFGNLTSYNTTTYSLSLGDTVYVSAASAGALTNTAPTSETNLIQNIGKVVRAHGSDGVIKVGGAGRSAATPNLNQDKIFLGNASNQAVSTALSSVNLSSFNDDLTYPVTSVNALTGAVVVSGNDIAADYTATNYTAANVNVDGHFSGVDTKFGTLGTASTEDTGTAIGDVVLLENVGGSAGLPEVDGSQLTNLPSAPVTSVNTLTGAVVVSGNDIAADHTATNYTAANANVDGHFSGVDTKLGTLLADITSESLGDLSDVTITAAASGEYLRYSGTAWVDASLAVADDSTPSLGGDLDTNGNELVTASNANLVLRPNGTGHVFLGGNTNPAELRLYCENADVHYVGLKSPAHSELSGSQTWRLPVADGTSGQAITTDGSGNLSFTTISGGGGSTPEVTAVSQGTDYTITYDSSVVEDVYLVTPTTDISINLPAAATCGSGYKYQIKNLGAFTLTIDPNSTEYIDHSGQTTFDIVQYESVTLITDGSNWFII